MNFNLKYILAILNSSLIKYFLKYNSGGKIDTYPDDWKKIPIKEITKSKQLILAKKAEILIDLNTKFSKNFSVVPDDIKLEVLANKIKQVKNNLNELVYKLYNITEEEKKIIESSV